MCYRVLGVNQGFYTGAGQKISGRVFFGLLAFVQDDLNFTPRLCASNSALAIGGEVKE